MREWQTQMFSQKSAVWKPNTVSSTSTGTPALSVVCCTLYCVQHVHSRCQSCKQSQDSSSDRPQVPQAAAPDRENRTIPSETLPQAEYRPADGVIGGNNAHCRHESSHPVSGMPGLLRRQRFACCPHRGEMDPWDSAQMYSRGWLACIREDWHTFVLCRIIAIMLRSSSMGMSMCMGVGAPAPDSAGLGGSPRAGAHALQIHLLQHLTSTYVSCDAKNGEQDGNVQLAGAETLTAAPAMYTLQTSSHARVCILMLHGRLYCV